jgi:hemolysin III
MGWMLMFVIKDIKQAMPTEILNWIFAGGISYTLGVYFYIKDHKKYFHTIWHIFVLIGSILHFIAVYKSI